MRKTGLYYRLALPIGASLIFLVCHAGSVSAQVGIAARVAQETREACAPDAMRLCSDYIPDVPKITTCMEERFAEVSSPCRAAMIREHYRAGARLRRSRVLSTD